MLTGLIFASVFGAMAMPDLMKLADALKGDDDEADAPPEPRGEGDLLNDMTPKAELSIDPVADTNDIVDEIVEVVPMIWDAVPGTHDVTGFDPDTQSLSIAVPENTTGYLSYSGDPDADPPVPASLIFEVPDGAIEMRFTGLTEIPEAAMSVIAAGGPAVELGALLLNGVPGLAPDDPEEPADPMPGLPGDGIPAVLEPDADPDPIELVTPLAPGSGVIPASVEALPGSGNTTAPMDDGSAPLEPAEATSPDPGTDITQPVPPGIANPVTEGGAPLLPDPQPVVIPAFDPSQDILQITGSADAILSIGASDDGADGEVFLDGVLTAIVTGMPDLTLDAIEKIGAA